MSDTTTNARKVLKRLLANGPLIAMPKRPRDAELLLGLAAARFKAGLTYGEHEVNELLQAWLETISAPYGIDHVSLRRHLIDAQFLLRDASGSTYRVSITKARPAVDVDPAQVLADIRRDREARKRQHAK
jgi:hypothetical protein